MGIFKVFFIKLFNLNNILKTFYGKEKNTWFFW